MTRLTDPLTTFTLVKTLANSFRMLPDKTTKLNDFCRFHRLRQKIELKAAAVENLCMHDKAENKDVWLSGPQAALYEHTSTYCGKAQRGAQEHF